jgi:multiple sugar transport system substrate-binding protein
MTQNNLPSGQIKQALMPAGPKRLKCNSGLDALYGLTTQAVADKTREANAVKLIEWFGGKADGKYTFQKNLLNDLGSGFGVNSLFKDPEVIHR